MKEPWEVFDDEVPRELRRRGQRSPDGLIAIDEPEALEACTSAAGCSDGKQRLERIMTASPGELLVGAYLKIVEGCDFVGYNVRPPGGGLRGLEELDVVGLDFESESAFLCEVTTHITGLLYKNNEETVRRVRAKNARQRAYADEYLRRFPKRHYMFWSPVVPKGYRTEHLRKIAGLELVINEEYTARIDRLREEAKGRANDEGNVAFRVLQILEHLRR